MSRPTLREVAAKAGLSVTQASRALNDHDDVAEATKERARAAAAELRYTPNREARRLKDPHASSGAIGIVLPTESLRFNDPFFGDLLSAMVVEAGEHKLQLTLSTPPPNQGASDPYDAAIREKQVDGFVVVRTIDDDPRIDFLLERSFPFVTFGRPLGKSGFPAVELAKDSFVPLVQHLVELGHRDVACMAEPPQFAIGSARLRSFLSAAADHGLRVAPDAVVHAGFHERAGFDSTGALLDGTTPPTAIVAMNDLLALGALRAAESRELSVPDDLTVVGFDDIQAARQVSPSLTTVRQSADEVGSLLIQGIVAAIASNRLEHDERYVTPELIIRQSSGRRPGT